MSFLNLDKETEEKLKTAFVNLTTWWKLEMMTVNIVLKIFLHDHP